MKKIVLLSMATLVMFGLASCGNNTSFKKKFADIENNVGVEIADDDSYIRLDTNPNDIDNGTLYASNVLDDIHKVNKELGFPESLNKKLENTTSLDGTQTQENQNFKASWSYHPDKGLEIMYEKMNK